MQYIPAKKIIIKNKSNSWFGTDYTMNIYKGCCHGCIYCDSRSDCYKIDNFDMVRTKDNSTEIIRNDLKSKNKTGIIGMGCMSDPYNPFEKELALTRESLKLIDKYQYGVAIATKSDLIARDIDILKNIQEHSPVICKVTITTFNDALCKKIESNVCTTSKRFLAIKKLADAGIFTGVLLMPVLPFINDNKENILSIVHEAKRNGSKFIYPAFGVTLRSNQRYHFYKKLDEAFPNIKSKYIDTFNYNYTCISPNAKELYSLFSKECEKLGLLYKINDIIECYKSNYVREQLSLF